MIDGRCDGCGEALASVVITLGGEDGYFCARCAPTGPARPRRSYSRVCQVCGGEAAYYRGTDHQGDDVWYCAECDSWQS